MKTKQILQNLRDYIGFNRRVGHTTAMIRGAQNVDNVLVLAANQHQAAMLQRELPRAEVVAITNPVCMIGKSKALVMDNHALWEIAGAALAEIERLEARIAELSLENFVIRSVGGCVISGGFGEEFLTEIRGTWGFPAI